MASTEELLKKNIAPVNSAYILPQPSPPFFDSNKLYHVAETSDLYPYVNKLLQLLQIQEQEELEKEKMMKEQAIVLEKEIVEEIKEEIKEEELVQVETKVTANELKMEQSTVEESKENSAGLLLSAEDAEKVEQARSKNREKGRNKNKQNKQIVTEVVLCQFFAKGKECPYGERCRSSHDLKLYLKTKSADIGDKCWFFDNCGSCPFGFTCRYGSSHIDKDAGVLLTKSVSDSKYPILEELNVFPEELLKSLRKWLLPFPLSDAIVKEYQKFDKIQKEAQNLLQSKNSKNPVVDAPVNPPKVEQSWKVFELENPTLGPLSLHKQINPKPLKFPSKCSILAPLTTVGNLPFRRLCKTLGVDVTVAEMTMSNNLLLGTSSELALIKRHPSEDIFGVQIAGSHVDCLAQAVELLNMNPMKIDFIDLNVGCPIEVVVNKGAGSGLMNRPRRLEHILRSMCSIGTIPITIKTRIGYDDSKINLKDLMKWGVRTGVSAWTIHGRTRQQRYSRLANWEYMNECRESIDDFIPIFGNGDIYSHIDFNEKINSGFSGAMIGRGALIKPWIFSEIKSNQYWDISASERMDLFQTYVNFGLEHWGSDSRGVQTTRKFLLEWMSFTHRYIPVKLLDIVPCQLIWKSPSFIGRGDTETMLSSPYPSDWVKMSEMFLGPCPKNYKFEAKHRATSYAKTELDSYQAQG